MIRRRTGSYRLMVWLLAIALPSLTGCTGTIGIGIVPTPAALETRSTLPETPTAQATSPPPATEAATVAPDLTLEPSPMPQTPTPTPNLASMSPSDPTSLPATVTPISAPPTPTVTPLPLTVTPLPPAPTLTSAPAAERILFAPGATQTTVEGYLPASGTKVYVMGVEAGQFVEVNAAMGTTGQGLRFSIVGADGSVVKALGESHVRTVVPSTQDYTIELASDVGAVNYQMSVLIPVRIRFAPGATSTEVAGSLAAGDTRHYVIRALAGQRMIVDPRATQGQVGLVIWGVDGQVLLSGRAGRPGSVFDGILPTTQDYMIGVRAEGGTGADYALEISIPPL